jgi:hypothetical protein
MNQMGNVPERPESPMAKLREQVHIEIDQSVAERLKSAPLPTDTEVMIGAYLEELEPQVRDAILVMYQKGYQTESSGFYLRDNDEAQVIDGYFDIDEETEEKLKGIGVRVVRGTMGDRTAIEFTPETADIGAMKRKWDEIAAVLPDRGTPAFSSGGSEQWLDRPDLRKFFIERRLALQPLTPEERELGLALIKELEKKSGDTQREGNKH